MKAKNKFVAGSLAIVMGTFCLVSGDASAYKSEFTEQWQERSQNSQELSHSYISDLLLQTRHALYKDNITQTQTLTYQINRDKQTTINQSQCDIDTVYNDRFSELKDETKALKKQMFNTYKKNKREEIDHKTEQALQELLDSK